MTYRIRAIEALEAGGYAVTFDDLDARTTLTIKCSVVNHEGIVGVQPEPDIFMNSGMSAQAIRAISAAVAAFDHARHGGSHLPAN